MPLRTAVETVESPEAHAGEVRKLTTILEASEALSATTHLKAALQRVLEMLVERHGVQRGAVLLLNEQTGEVDVEASVDATRPGRRARYRPDEAITSEVVQRATAVVVPLVSGESTLAARSSNRPESGSQGFSHVSAPVLFDGRPIGALGVDLLFEDARDHRRTVTFVRVLASLIANAVKVHRATEAERRRLVDENAHLRIELKERYDFSNLIGTSGPMRRVQEQVVQVAPTNTTVLLRGESGTGKELIANAIHYHSPRAAKPLVKVSCAALPHDLIESELFGYEKGAFTGAQTSKKGRFEAADGGTLFLDEIGDLNPGTQVKLLRVLQERRFERLGGTETIRVNIRLIAATNKDLERAISAGEFREDLYFRLNVFAIFMPPLRERKPDVFLLADHFLEKFSREHRKSIRRISTPAIDMLASYHWPGNVRELANAIERAVVVCDSNVLHAHHLPPTLQTAEASGTTMQQSLQDLVEAVEKDAIQDALKSARGRRATAARLLSTTDRILNYKVRRYGIDWKRFRP